MNKAEQLKFKNQLERSLSEITDNIDRVNEAAKPVELDQNRVGRLSRMDAMQGQAMAQASSQRKLQQAQLIKQALTRIELSEFGDCLECGDAIANNRLNIDPSAKFCIQCAEHFEKR